MSSCLLREKKPQQPLHQLNARPCSRGNRAQTSASCPGATRGSELTLLAFSDSPY